MKADLSQGLCFICILLAQSNIIYSLAVNNLGNEIDLALEILREAPETDSVQFDYITKKSEDDFMDTNKVDLSQKAELIKGVPHTIPCAKFSHPKNGEVQCGGRLCLIKCKNGYSHSDDTAFVYACNLATQKWETLPENKPIPWPDCVPDSIVEELRK